MKHSHFVHKRYHGKYSIEDLVQEAKLGAIKAFRTFDPSKNVKLITHIYNYINFYLSHYTRYDTGLIKIPNAAFSDLSKIPEIVDSEIFQENYINERCKTSSITDALVINKILTEEYLSILTDKENVVQLVKDAANKMVDKLKDIVKKTDNKNNPNSSPESSSFTEYISDPAHPFLIQKMYILIEQGNTCQTINALLVADQMC